MGGCARSRGVVEYHAERGAQRLLGCRLGPAGPGVPAGSSVAGKLYLFISNTIQELLIRAVIFKV